MTLGNRIAQYRKNMSITQEALAQQLGVTNQAVSKWESDQCCPDVALLPKLADIFGITLDALFGRETESGKEKHGLALGKLFKIPGTAENRQLTVPAPAWPDDDTLRVVACIGHRVVVNEKARKEITFRYEGPALNVDSHLSIVCGDVQGNADAGTSICCGNVCGDVDAGTYVSCGNVEGDVDAGTNVGCGNVAGSVDAGTHVKCGDVGGDVDAGCDVECGQVHGDVDAGGSIRINR